jgi:chorismate dehydratase
MILILGAVTLTIGIPAKSFNGKKILVSSDGSLTFYNSEYGQSYRALSSGAFTESLVKFVLPSGVIEKTSRQDLRILDICFGLGYNCAVCFDRLSTVSSPNLAHIVSVEKDETLIPLVSGLNVLFPLSGYSILKNCLMDGRCGRFSMELHIRDALDVIEDLRGAFDAIFFDPFSMAKNPEMWSVPVFKRLRELLAEDGRLLTYAGGKKVREAMREAGLKPTDTPAARNAFMPGTAAMR